MDIHPGFQHVSSPNDVQALAFGFFDGVHLGHARVFDAVRAGGHPLSILTFWPHPQLILHPTSPPALITGLEHKLELFRQAGAEQVILHSFDAKFAQVEAGDFLHQLFERFPRLRCVACGPNFHFGHHRSGNPDMLREFAKQRGIDARVPQLALHQNSPISSSRIREALQKGALEDVRAMLGRPYTMRGTVVRGRQLARQLGHPTANVATDDAFLLPPGVYAGRTRLPDGTSWPSAINIGTKPTVEASALPSLETHLIGYNGVLNDQVLEVEPLAWLRTQQKFGDLSELKRAIEADVLRVSNLVLDSGKN
jgi:riboflavin kinase/FMN adenylyltransferase